MQILQAVQIADYADCEDFMGCMGCMGCQDGSGSISRESLQPQKRFEIPEKNDLLSTAIMRISSFTAVAAVPNAKSIGWKSPLSMKYLAI